jgi:NAD(P)H-hydrate repair Nnr-like enzyme with NAD(P)H-hydrate epimerase domain
MAEELLTPEEMAEVDRAAPGLGVPIAALMENAGRAVARAVLRRFPPCRVLVLCGPGNNGGDGLVAARHLRRAGWPVAVAALAPLPGRWDGLVRPFAPEAAARAELVIDAVFGAGLSRALDPPVIDVLRAARRIVAVDVPSGLHGADGQPRGYAPQAALTVTFFRRKPGHLLLPGRGLCGELVLADIGFPPGVLDAVTPRAWRNGPWLWTVPRPTAEGHKYARGHVTVLGGAAMTGAARLAAMAARRGGAGMVTIAAPKGGGGAYRAGEPGTIVAEAPLADLLGDERRQTWVCGPGLGADLAADALPVLLASGRQVVVDADALTLCAGAPERLRGAAVLTPHAGEFARVFGDPGTDRSCCSRGPTPWSRRPTGGSRSTTTRRHGLPRPAPATCWPG